MNHARKNTLYIMALVLAALAAAGCRYNDPFPEEEFIKVAAAGDIEAASKMLDEHPALVHARQKTGFPSPLRAAVVNNHVELVAMMLDRGAVANEWIEGRPQPILLAATPEMLEVLLENRALPNVRDKFGLTPLHLAVERNDARSVEVLLQHGVDPEIADNIGTTPLLRAARDGRTEIVRALLKGGANIDARDRVGRTALDLALENARAATAEVIRGFMPG